jgi:hypothetical protein
LAGPHRSNLYVEFLVDSKTASPTAFHNFELTVAPKLSIEIGILGVVFLPAMETSAWTAHLHCPAHVRGDVEARVRAFPPSFLEEPIDGEVFDNFELCRERLQGFAFSQGFAIIQTSGSMRQAHPRFYFQCIHRGDSTANWRKLEDHIKRDEKDNITTCCKQEATNINTIDCPYLVYLAFKQIGKRDSSQYNLVLGVKSDGTSNL